MGIHRFNSIREDICTKVGCGSFVGFTGGPDPMAINNINKVNRCICSCASNVSFILTFCSNCKVRPSDSNAISISIVRSRGPPIARFVIGTGGWGRGRGQGSGAQLSLFYSTCLVRLRWGRAGRTSWVAQFL